MAIAFGLLLHAHQPAGNFDAVLEQTYAAAYAPFLDALEPRTTLNFNLHFSGFLLDWLAQRHPAYIHRLRALVEAGRLEILGGGYYEPILPALRRADRGHQIERLSRRIQDLFGCRPRGLWLAERVWEPDLPEDIVAAGLEYTVLDDAHFLLAGLEPGELHGAFITESQGAALRVLPSSLFLRQAIPFLREAESIDHLVHAAVHHPGGLLCMGDDLEKFGGWPHTFEHVYTQGWLARFLDLLESRRDAIATVRLANYLDAHPPRRRVYLPTASYPEMMEWALPQLAAARFEQARKDPTFEPYRRFLAGSPWRGFLARYRESNLLHKTQIDLSRRLQSWRDHHPTPALSELQSNLYQRALDHLHAGQANDAYWHGWFGGLYAPHLREFLFAQLVAAGELLERLEGSPTPLRIFDLDLDGCDEVEMRTPTLRALLAPADGGCLEELDYRPTPANLINSLQRRPEVYHQSILERAASNPANLPGGVVIPFDLGSRLRYDRYPRSGGRLLLLSDAVDFERYRNGMYDADPGPAGGEYQLLSALPGSVALTYPGGVEKRYQLEELPPGSDFAARLTLQCLVPPGSYPALEWVFNLLAPDAPDRGLIQDHCRYGLAFEGELPAAPLGLVDGWRGLQIRLDAPAALAWWIAPIFTVSQSEAGFESIYQGSALTAVWPLGTEVFQTEVLVGPGPSR